MASFPFYTMVIAALLVAPVSGLVCLVGNDYHAIEQGDFKYCVTVRDNEIDKEVYYGTNDDIDLSGGWCYIEMIEDTPLEYCYCARNHCNHMVRFKYFSFMNILMRFRRYIFA